MAKKVVRKSEPLVQSDPIMGKYTIVFTLTGEVSVEVNATLTKLNDPSSVLKEARTKAIEAVDQLSQTMPNIYDYVWLDNGYTVIYKPND